jgi:hypothetical protein
VVLSNICERPSVSSTVDSYEKAFDNRIPVWISSWSCRRVVAKFTEIQGLEGNLYKRQSISAVRQTFQVLTGQSSVANISMLIQMGLVFYVCSEQHILVRYNIKNDILCPKIGQSREFFMAFLMSLWHCSTVFIPPPPRTYSFFI